MHSAVAQADNSRKRGGPVRREPVESEVGLPLTRRIDILITDHVLAPRGPPTSSDRRESSLRQPRLHEAYRWI